MNKKIISQISDSLKYIHERGYLHSDLKPDNILLINMYDDETSSFIKKINKFDFDYAVAPFGELSDSQWLSLGMKF